MRQIIRTTTLTIAVCCVALTAAAQTAQDFYLGLLRRGIAAFDAGRYAEATSHLQIAAFGFVDKIELYETAQVHLAVAHDRLGDRDNAAAAARRVLVADRIEPRYTSLALSAAVREAFETIARKTLTSTELAQLMTPRPAAKAAQHVPIAPPARPQESAPVPQTSQQLAAAQPQETLPNQPQQRPPAQSQQPTAQPEQPAAQPEQPAVKRPETAATERPSADASRSVERAATAPTRTSVPTQQPKSSTAAVPASVPASPQPFVTAPAVSQSALAPAEVAARLIAADRALTHADLAEARRIYNELLEQRSLDRRTLLAIAEGLYRAREFDGALVAFRRLGGLRSGEEPYGYYVAVALFETGDRAGARRELSAALPHIEITPDVARYRAKIAGQE